MKINREPKEMVASLVGSVRDLARGMGMRVAPKVTDGDDEGGYEVEFTFANSGLTYNVTVGWPTLVKTLSGSIPFPGYRVYYWKTSPGTRYIPPDVEDITLCEVTHEYAAVKSLFIAVVSNEVDCYYESLLPNEEPPEEDA